MADLFDSLYSLLVNCLLLGAIGVGGLGTLLYLFQRSLIYAANVPTNAREVVDTPDRYGMDFYEHLTLQTKDHVSIRAFFIQTSLKQMRKTAPTVLYCHANAGNMGHRLTTVRVFVQQFHCNVLIFSYRGYGLSEGSPSEDGLNMDAQTSLDYLLKDADIDRSKIIVFGQSIGGAVAIHLASKNEQHIRALIVENTFLSLPKLIPSVMPIVKYFTFLCTEIWPSEKQIALIHDIPVLFISGLQDELIPPSHMKSLFNICKSKQKTLATVSDGTHNTTCLSLEYWNSIAKFLTEIN